MSLMDTQKITKNKLGIINLFLAAMSGCLLVLAFPRFNWFFVAWFALAPLLFAIYHSSFKGALFCSLMAGIVFFGGLLYWLFIFGLLAGFSLILCQAIFILLFGLGAKLIHSYFKKPLRLIFIPALWVSIEFIRSIGPWGFSWGVLGYSQHNFLPVIQIARWAGVFGISFLLVFVNEFIAESYISAFCPSWSLKNSVKVFSKNIIVVLIGVFLLTGIGYFNLLGSQKNENTTKIAILQPSIPQEIKWEPMKKEDIFNIHLKLARKAAEKKPQFIIWPETATPAYLMREKEYLKEIKSLAKETNSYLIVGGLREEKGCYFNSVFIFSPEGEKLGHYDKLHLVPFGEYVPLRPLFSNIKAVAAVTEDMSAGDKLTVFETDRGKFSTVICFESADSLLVHRLASKGAEMLVVITNDGWFKRTAAAEQHLSMAVLRAVENDFFVVQAANTGISAVIDSRGRVLSETALFERRYLLDEVTLKEGKSFYRRFGNLFSYCCILISFGCFLFIIYSKNRAY